jgi:hypothetical protein
MAENTKVSCKVLKSVRIYGKSYKKGETVDVESSHINHYGKSIERIKQTKLKGEVNGTN